MTYPDVTTIAQHAPVLAERFGHHGPGDGPGWWIVFPIAWFLLLAGGLAAVVVSVRRRHRLAGRRAGEARLAERYAAGEIDDEEYRRRLNGLRTMTE
ncbi:SHOCT domain-containing protein [Georgenia deserti]|uniref:SHOCT domain-containing protein n=1 Tax=Georgenia deserti TaxID=2093781 RepID=A0ABW4LB81_9MICO